MSKLKQIVSGVYEQGVVDEHGEVKPGEMIYPDLAIQPSDAEQRIKDLMLELADETTFVNDSGHDLIDADAFRQKVEAL